MNEVMQSLRLFRPELALTAGLLLVVLVDAAGPSLAQRRLNRLLTVASLVAALVLCLPPAGGTLGQRSSAAWWCSTRWASSSRCC